MFKISKFFATVHDWRYDMWLVSLYMVGCIKFDMVMDVCRRSNMTKFSEFGIVRFELTGYDIILLIVIIF